ncbi:MAG TPA: LUD domain-containing protein [Acidobacteriaceae bacterium]|jgi:L-lactate dehydrogenase complex protein LldG|nr:LUD domain-containing protein [Acidobacteriaceae bacterium]
MADARQEILDRIRAGLGDRSATPAAVEYPAIERSYIRRGRLDPEERLALFLDRLRDYDAHVVETTAGALAQTIAGILAEHRQKKVIAADGLAAGILPASFAFMPEREAGVDELNGCDGIVTTCTVAIAFTGTIVLTHGPGEGARRLTLLPDRHLCIVRADQVVETVPEGFDRLAGFATRPLTFISGPSATADIEMTRIRGVHGPRFMDAVLVR